MKNGRWQLGDLGPDGRRFVRYMKCYRNGEYWLSEDAFLINYALMLLNNKMRQEDGSRKLSDAAYYAANLEKVKASHAAYRAANPDKARARVAAWRTANPEKVRAAVSAWSTANPEKRNATEARRRARKLKATTATHDKKIEEVFHAMRIRLTDCLRTEFHVDHLTPLAAGGKHDHRNLMVIPAVWNQRKRDSTDYPMPACWLPAFPDEISP